MPIKPVPMRNLIPPVTGIGNPSNVNSNQFDMSGTYRPRSGSKRRRGESPLSDLESMFDLTRSYPPPVIPTPPKLDLGGVRSLMVEAAAKVKELAPILMDKRTTDQNKTCVNTVIALYSLIESVVEKAVVPLIDALQGGAAASVAAVAIVLVTIADRIRMRQGSGRRWSGLTKRP